MKIYHEEGYIVYSFENMDDIDMNTMEDYDIEEGVTLTFGALKGEKEMKLIEASFDEDSFDEETTDSFFKRAKFQYCIVMKSLNEHFPHILNTHFSGHLEHDIVAILECDKKGDGGTLSSQMLELRETVQREAEANKNKLYFLNRLLKDVDAYTYRVRSYDTVEDMILTHDFGTEKDANEYINGFVEIFKKKVDKSDLKIETDQFGTTIITVTGGGQKAVFRFERTRLNDHDDAEEELIGTISVMTSEIDREEAASVIIRAAKNLGINLVLDGVEFTEGKTEEENVHGGQSGVVVPLIRKKDDKK